MQYDKPTSDLDMESQEDAGSGKSKSPEILDFYKMLNVVDIRAHSPERWTNDVNDPFPKFPRKWYFVDDGTGARIPHVLADDNTIRRKVPAELCRDIAEYCQYSDPASVQYKWSFTKLMAVTDFVIANSRSVISYDSVKIIAWKSDPDVAFHRLPFDRCDVGEDPLATIMHKAPIFWEFLSRFKFERQAVAYCQWLGSVICDLDNKIHRGVILYGEGRNGKSTQLRFLDHILGESVRYKNCGDKTDFKTDGIENCRIVAYADVGNTSIFTDATTKGLIGGDKIEINRKGVPQFQVRPRAKVIACTNKIPKIRDSIAETRRWIYCDIDGFEGETDPEYQAKCNAEAEIVVGCCAAMFDARRSGADIDTDPEALEEVISMTQAGVEYFCKRNFEPDKDGFVRNCDIAALIGKQSKRRFDHQTVGTFLRKKYKCQSATRRIDKEVFRGQSGIRLTHYSATELNFINDVADDGNAE